MSSFTNNALPPWEVFPLQNTVVRLRRPQGKPASQAFILLHGWTGDENFMTPFAAFLPAKALVVAFRAPYPARSPRGGYSWIDYDPAGHHPSLENYHGTFARLTSWLYELQQRYPAPAWERQHWMGFSQGASIVGGYALWFPETVTTVALLSGFLPRGAEKWAERRPLTGKAAFIAHGIEDHIVDIARAREAREILTTAGAEVTYCEDNVKHKVGVRCKKALEAFYQRHAAA